MSLIKYLIGFIIIVLLIGDYTYSQSKLVINEILVEPLADANGDGTIDANDMFVELVNMSGKSVDITGWTISDNTFIRYTFPGSTVIQGGGAIVVFGGGTPSGSFGGAIVKTAKSLDLDNSGDIVVLKNNSGDIIDKYIYGTEVVKGQSIARSPDKTGGFKQHSTLLGGLYFSPGKSNTNSANSFPLATIVTATMTDALVTDINSSGNVNPGEQIEYTVVISNTGTENAESVRLINTVDANTTFVPGSIVTSPIAVNDPNGGLPSTSAPSGGNAHPYHTALNTTLNVADGVNDLLNNDNLGSPAATIISYGTTGNPNAQTTIGNSTPTNNGGTVAINTNGSFTYNPPNATYTGTDQFAYSIQNVQGSSTCTVTVGVGFRPTASNENYTTATGNTIVGNVSINTDNSTEFSVLTNDVGDQLTIESFDATSVNGGNVSIQTNGKFTYNPFPGFEGSDSFTYTVDNGFNTPQIAIVSLTVNEVVWFINASAGAGDGRRGTPFNTVANFNSTAVDQTEDIIFVSNGAYSSAPITLLNNQKLIGEGASGTFSSATGLTLPADADALPSVGGTAPAISNSGSTLLTLASGNTLNGVAFGNSSTAISGSSFGTLTVSNTSINTNGTALSLSTGTVNGTFSSVSSSGGTNNITLTTVAGTFTINGGSLSGATGTSFNISGGTGTVTYNGSITKSNANNAVNIGSKTGGTVTFNGTIMASTTTTNSVNISNNTGAVINFSGNNLSLTTTSGICFNATGGGTVNVTGTGNIISSTTGTALNVANTTIGASGLIFQSISSNGAVSGIVLNNTGSSGGLTVTGNGGSCTAGSPTCTGGTIAGSTDIGIKLTSTTNPSFTRMRINSSTNFGLNGSSVTGMTIDACVFDGIHGNAVDEGALFVTNWLGSGSITNSEILGGFNDNVRVNNTTGTLNRLTVSGTTIRNSGNNHGLAFYTCLNGAGGSCPGLGPMNLTVINSIFTDNSANSLNIVANDGSGMDVVLQNNTFQSTSLDPVTGPNGSVLLAIDHSADMTFDVNGNTFTNPKLSAFTAFVSNQTLAAASMIGKFRNNTIGTSGIPLSGSRQGSGMQVTATGAATITMAITGNTIRNWATNNGMDLSSGDGGATGPAGESLCHGQHLEFEFANHQSTTWYQRKHGHYLYRWCSKCLR